MTTANSVTSVTAWTNADAQRYLVRFRGARFAVTPGSAAARVFLVVRRVPSGYTAPAITVGTGLTAIIDQPDVLAWGLASVPAASLTGSELNIPLRALKPTMPMYEGDTLVIQAVSDASSTNQAVSGFMEFGTRS